MKKSLSLLLSCLMVASVLGTGAVTLGFAKGGAAYAADAQMKAGDTLKIKGEKGTESWESEYIVLDPTKTNTGEKGAFILLKNPSEKTAFGSNNTWSGSTAQTWCTRYFVSLPDELRKATIGVVTNETDSGHANYGINNIDGTASTIKDKAFFLSYQEYDAYKASIDNLNDNMWLRSPSSKPALSAFAGYISTAGEAKVQSVSTSSYARPAMNIDLTSVGCVQEPAAGGTTWTINTKGHNLKKTDAKASSCYYEGNIEFWTCEDCGKVFSDAAGTTEITMEDTVLPKQHTKFTHVPAKAATCTEKGNVEYWYCSNCYEYYLDEAATNKTTGTAVKTDALGHKWDSGTVTVAPEVDKEGKKVYTCQNDASHKREEVIPALKKPDDASKVKAGDYADIGAEAAGYSGRPYWRILAKEDGKILVMSEYLWSGDGTDAAAKIKFDPSNTSNKWQGSNAQTWCQNFENAVLKDVKGIVIEPTTKSDAAFSHKVSTYSTLNFAAGNNILSRDNVFFLSAEEVVNYMPTEADRTAYLPDGSTTDLWWTRSADSSSAKKAGDVLKNGKLGSATAYTATKARPAFWMTVKDNACASSSTVEGVTTWAFDEHVLTKTDEVQPASCKEKGHKAYWTCSVCNKMFSDADGTKEIEEPETIESSDHDWGEPSYEWATDKSTVTAKRVCKNDATHVETETADASPKETKAATCEEAGETEYTSEEFKNAAFEKQTTTVAIDALGHDYGKWEKKDDASHQRVCTRNDSHVETEAHQWDAGVVTKEATEKEEGVKTFTCSVCEATRTEAIPKKAPKGKATVTLGTTKVSTVANYSKRTMAVSWKKVSGATGYKLSYRMKGGKWTTKSTTANKYTVKGMKNGKLYEFKVAATKKATAKTKAATGKYSPVHYRYFKTIKARAKGLKNSVKLTWNKDMNANGYIVYIATNKNMKNPKSYVVKGASGKSYTFKGLKKGKRYYVMVRAYKNSGGHRYDGITCPIKSAKAR